MSRSSPFPWAMIFVAPLVAAGVAAGLWLAATAAYENIRLAQATDQILGVVAVSRDIAVDYKGRDDQAATVVLDRLAPLTSMHVVEDTATKQRALVNPWRGLTGVAPSAGMRELRLQMEVPSIACLRLAKFYASAPASLGLQRIEVRANAPEAVWQTHYDLAEGRVAVALTPRSVKTACDKTPQTTVALTFRLR